MASYARWGVESWALALGVVSEKDIANPFQCPSCGKSGNSRKAIAGRIVRCPNCNVRLKVSDNGLQFGVVTEGKSEKSELADALVDEKGNGKRIYLSTDLSDEPSELLRQRLRQAMAEGFITKDDTVILRKLRESLGVSQEHAQSLFDEVVGELNQLFPPTDMRPKAVTPFLDDPLDSTNQTAKAAEPSQTVTRVEIPMDPYGRVLCFLNLFLVFSVLVIRIFAVGLSFWTFCSTFLLWVLSSGAGIEILKTENRKRAKYLSAPMLMLGLPLLVIVSTFAGKESVLFGGLFFWFEFVTVFILSLLLAGASNPK
jgi:ribosomal protein L37AE/L43A